jgi:hypothetical protein
LSNDGEDRSVSLIQQQILDLSQIVVPIVRDLPGPHFRGEKQSLDGGLLPIVGEASRRHALILILDWPDRRPT